MDLLAVQAPIKCNAMAMMPAEFIEAKATKRFGLVSRPTTSRAAIPIDWLI